MRRFWRIVKYRLTIEWYWKQQVMAFSVSDEVLYSLRKQMVVELRDGWFYTDGTKWLKVWKYNYYRNEWLLYR